MLLLFNVLVLQRRCTLPIFCWGVSHGLVVTSLTLVTAVIIVVSVLLSSCSGEGQRTVIKLKLDSMADSVSGQTVIDPKGYLTDLSGMVVSSSSEISDIKKVGGQ